MSERHEGWYWVNSSGEWETAEYRGDGEWYVTGSSMRRYNDSFNKIGPRIPAPDEPFKCVPIEPTDEMVDAASEMYMPFGDMGAAVQAAIIYAPEGDQ